MGMYDDIRFEVDIPGDPKPKHPQFQTKDFDCEMDSYVVKKDGALHLTSWDPDVKEFKEIGPRDYHGMLRFYTLEDIEGTGVVGRRSHTWFEYQAKFTDGKLQDIKVVDISRWDVATNETTHLWPAQGKADAL
jgi:hypothetical protein